MFEWKKTFFLKSVANQSFVEQLHSHSLSIGKFVPFAQQSFAKNAWVSTFPIKQVPKVISQICNIANGKCPNSIILD